MSSCEPGACPKRTSLNTRPLSSVIMTSAIIRYGLDGFDYRIIEIIPTRISNNQPITHATKARGTNHSRKDFFRTDMLLYLHAYSINDFRTSQDAKNANTTAIMDRTDKHPRTNQ